MQQWQNWDEISLYIFSMCFPYFLLFFFFMNIHEYANYENMITCIFDHGMKGLCLSFNLVQMLVIYGQKQLRYY